MNFIELCLIYSFKHLFIWKRHWQRRREHLPSHGLVPKWPQHEGLDQTQVGAPSWSSTRMTGSRGRCLSSAAFPDPWQDAESEVEWRELKLALQYGRVVSQAMWLFVRTQFIEFANKVKISFWMPVSSEDFLVVESRGGPY